MRIPGRYARRNFVAVLYDRVRTNELTQLKKFFSLVFFFIKQHYYTRVQQRMTKLQGGSNMTGTDCV